MSEITWRRPQVNLAAFVGTQQIAVVFQVYNCTDFGWWLYGERGAIVASGRCETETEAKHEVESRYRKTAPASVPQFID